MHMTSAQLAFGITGTLLLVVVLATMVRKNLRRHFPIFFAYIAWVLLTGVVQAFAYRLGPVTYFYVYWSLNAVAMMLGFGVLYEVFANVLKPYSALIDLSRLLFVWAGIFLLLAAVTTGLASGGSEPTRIYSSVMLFERIVRLMQCGLLLLLMIFDSRLGLSWRNYGMGIALGFGSYAAIDLIVSYLSIHCSCGQGGAETLGMVDSSAYLASTAFWVIVLALPQPSRKTVLDSPARLIFQRWNEALLASPLASRTNEIAAMSPVESFLPGVERTVERVMARKMMH